MLCVAFIALYLAFAFFLRFGFWVGCRSRSCGLGIQPYTHFSIKGLDQFFYAYLCFVCPFPCVYVWIHACMLRICFLHPCHTSHVFFPFVGFCGCKGEYALVEWTVVEKSGVVTQIRSMNHIGPFGPITYIHGSTYQIMGSEFGYGLERLCSQDRLACGPASIMCCQTIVN